ncbi:DUF1963 domain-containing protein [Pseudomonas lundensis]|uniref:DUF1963 domain-containing protein n=1 Tax=Pseudomonas lundensis TaxID=86185 RepID=UPI00147659FD|nr:DUF1963 domain-containing protein [Pseudomonas lundensis]NNA03334.1 DUF1963 domain-containing protein [Pseudomonas lundensis]
MFNELVFLESAPNSNFPYLGGSPYLPKSIVWPVDSTGNPLLHLATFPAAFINKYAPVNLGLHLVVSVFTPYSKKSNSYIEKAMTEGGKIIAYVPSGEPVDGYGDPILPVRWISVFKNPGEDSDENGIAKISGIPSWIQDEEVHGDLKYILQINNSRLNKAAPSHKSIFIGGGGFLLLKSNINCEDLMAGKLVIQTS